jgi:hypothetical protein
MKKLILVATLAASLVPLCSAQAGIFGRRWSRQTYPSSYYYSQPAPQYAGVPANPAPAYRSYSYQPDPYQPAEFQQSNPAYGYPTQQPRNETGEPYHDAGFKVRGF